jgi:hypothetical protein
MELTIGEEARTVEPGAMFLIASNVPHKAVAVEEPLVALDVFSPIREDYAKLFNRYIGPTDAKTEWTHFSGIVPLLCWPSGSCPPEELHTPLPVTAWEDCVVHLLGDILRGTEKSQHWLTFLHNHLPICWGMDFFTAPTIRFQILYVFVVLSHSRRQVMHFGVTAHPTMTWVIPQLREATPFGLQPTYLFRDNDQTYGEEVGRFLLGTGIQPVRTAYRNRVAIYNPSSWDLKESIWKEKCRIQGTVVTIGEMEEIPELSQSQDNW